MNPLKLTLVGFRGIRAGLGVDQIEIDLTSIDPAAQLVAIAGPNGAGKSTILDNLHPFRLMPSRAGGYSPGSFSYFDQVYGPYALKELEWSHAGATYRTTIVIKTPGKTKTQECYLHRMEGAAWVPVEGSDGKAKTHDAAVESILGTPEMFFTAAFSAQGRPSLSSYTNGRIKDLLSELLGLNAVLEYSARANDRAKQLKNELESLRGDLKRIEVFETAIPQQEASIRHVKGQIPAAADAVTEARDRATKAQTTVLRETQALQNGAETEAKRAGLSQRAADIGRAIVSETKAVNADIAAARKAVEDAASRARLAFSSLDARAAQAEQRKKRAQETLQRKDEINAAALSVPEIQEKIRDAERHAADLSAQSETLRKLEQEAAAVRAKLHPVKATGSAAASSLERLKKSAELADRVPCAGTDLQGRCMLLADAVKSREGIPDAATAVEKLRCEYRETATRAGDLTEKAAALAGAREKERDARVAINDLLGKLRAAERLAAMQGQLETAAQDLEAAEQELGRIATEQAETTAAAEAAKRDGEQRVAELQTRLDDRIQQHRADAAGIQAEIDALPAPHDETALNAAKHARSDADADLAQAERKRSELQAQVTEMEVSRQSMRDQLAALGETRARAANIADDIAHWSTLAKALGRDGIVALSIDDAGPTLAALTNDILTACYGPRFTVAIRTQETTQAGTDRETFDIVVFDAERDDEKSVSTMSGGERIWINEALTRAIALYQAQQSGADYECLFADESDGALDASKKEQFIAMKRKVLQLGGYRREYFISHSADSVDSADAVIDVRGLALQEVTA